MMRRAIISGGPRDGEEREIDELTWARGQLIVPIMPAGGTFEKYDDGQPPPPPTPSRERYVRSTVTTALGEYVTRWIYKGTY